MRCRSAGFFLAILAAVMVSRAMAASVSASSRPPGGVSSPPQFILFSHDDAVNNDAYRYVTEVTNQFRNPNGCKITATWFACTKDCDFSCTVATQLYNEGHEIATHTVNHPDLRPLSYSKVSKEIVGARDTIVGCGIPSSKVNGFRTPFLSDSPTVRKVLLDNGFRYDSTIGVKGGRNKLWPATMDRGVPYDCREAGQQCSSSERYPGMWEVPLYTASDGNLMDYCTNENNGKPRPGCSAYSVLKKAFDDAYGSNRAPVTVGVHSVTTGYLQSSKFRKDVVKFFKYAMGKPEVWAVTHQQLLDWMEAPVPASEMPKFMARYKSGC